MTNIQTNRHYSLKVLKMEDCVITAYPLSREDRMIFNHLRDSFGHKINTVKEDRHRISFTQEIQMIINFVERLPDNRDVRAINAGFAFFGAYICINTRQLKKVMSRCKSSINSSLQSLGYSSIKTKSKTFECLRTVIPTLGEDQDIAKQWTVRFSPSVRGYPFVLKPIVRPVIHPMPVLKKTVPLVMPIVSTKRETVQNQNVAEIDLNYPQLMSEDDFPFSRQELEWDFSLSASW